MLPHDLNLNAQRIHIDYMPVYFLRFGGFSEGVFPGVSLLSRCLLSGLPVVFAILLGPGFNAITVIFGFYLMFKFDISTFYVQYRDIKSFDQNK